MQNVIAIAVFAPRPADLRARLIAAGFYEETPQIGANYGVIVPLRDGEPADDAVARACTTLRIGAGARIAWSDPFPITNLTPVPTVEA